MKFEDVLSLTRDAVAQALGTSYMSSNGYLEGIPAEKLIDVGKDVADGEITLEKFTKALVSLLGKFEVYADEFKPFFNDILVDRIEWGGFIERAYIDFADIVEDPTYSLTDGTSYADIEHRFYQPKASAKIYNEEKAIMIPISIQRSTLMEAFRDYGSMHGYIEKIKAKVKDTLRLAIDRYCAILVEGGIVTSTKVTNNAIYLIDEAVAAGVDGITTDSTADECLQNDAMVSFVMSKIAEVRSNFRATSTAYNNGNLPVSSYDNVLYLHSKFANRMKFGVIANTFNKDEVKLDYKEIPMWQAVKSNGNTSFSFEDTSVVDFTADSSNKLGAGTDAIKIDGVIGFLWDKRALGMTIYKEYMTNSYTACADFWNEFLHSATNCIIDSNFPMVAFLLAHKSE